MSETYAEIMEDLKKHDNDYAVDYCMRFLVDPSDESSSYFHDAACDIARRVRDAVAGDSTQWYQLDADDNEIKIGDDFIYFGQKYSIYGFSFNNVIFSNENGALVIAFKHLLHKVLEDTQEKIDTDFKKLKSDAEANVLTSGVLGVYEVKDLLEGFDDILTRQRKLEQAVINNDESQ